MADKNFRVKNGLEVGGTEIDIAQGTTIEYSENNNPDNRPVIKSTTGNASGLRVIAPNATSSAQAVVSTFSTNDIDNSKFISIQARGSTDPLRIQTGEYTAGVVGPSGDAVAFADGGTVYATVNPAGVLNNSDLATKLYVDSQVDSNTTYTVDASSTTGGANFNLVGSDSTTDTIKFANGTNVTVTATDANTITIAATDTNTTYDFNASSTTGGANLNLVGSDSTTDTVKISSGTGVSVAQISGTEVSVAIGQSVGTGDTPSFAGVSAGNLTVGVATDNTIASTNTNGDIILDPNGTGRVISAVTVMEDASRVKGAIEYTRNDAFTVPPALLTSVTANNGVDIFSNGDPSNNGYGAQCSLTYYQGDTAAGSASSASFQLRGAQGTNTTPTTSQSGDNMGAINFSGYANTGFTNYVASTNQGGGLLAYHPLQIQSIATETPVETAFTLANAVQGGNGILRQTITIGSVVSSGSGVFTNTSADVRRNDVVRVTGTLTGTMTFPGYVDGNLYYVTAGANPTTTFTLSATPGGAPVATTAGTTTGLAFNRFRVQFNYATQTAAPFFTNSKVTIAGSTAGKFDGTGWAVFSNTTGTAMGMYIPAAGNQAGAAGTIGLTNVTGAASFRVRGFVTGQPINNANRVNFIDHNSATATYRSDLFTFQSGSTTANVTGNNIVYNRVYGQWVQNGPITPAAANTSYVFAPGTATDSNIATIVSTSRITPGAAGFYNLQFSLQWNNSDNTEHTFYVWLRKNGVNVTNSAGKIVCLKSADGVNSWNYVLNSANTTDYWELAYQVSNTAITFPYVAAQGTAPNDIPGVPALITTLTPVGA